MSVNYYFKNKKDRALQIQEMLQEVLKEVKSTSKMTWQQIANKFDEVDINNFVTSDFLRQYRAGKKSVGIPRYKNILRLSIKCGFSNKFIDDCFDDIKNLEIFEKTLTPQAFTDSLEKIYLKAESNEQLLKTKAFNNLKDAIKNIVELDFNDAEIIYMASSILETEMPAHRKTYGAAVISPFHVMDFQDENLANEPPVVMCWRVAKN